MERNSTEHDTQYNYYKQISILRVLRSVLAVWPYRVYPGGSTNDRQTNASTRTEHQPASQPPGIRVWLCTASCLGLLLVVVVGLQSAFKFVQLNDVRRDDNLQPPRKSSESAALFSTFSRSDVRLKESRNG